jgi:hypothetical protein
MTPGPSSLTRNSDPRVEFPYSTSIQRKDSLNLDRLIIDVKRAHAAACQQLKEAQRRQQRVYDLRTNELSFNVGDLVHLHGKKSRAMSKAETSVDVCIRCREKDGTGGLSDTVQDNFESGASRRTQGIFVQLHPPVGDQGTSRV